MTHRVGSFYDPTTAAQTFLNLLHPDLIANGWTREETNLDSGAWRWDVYKNAAANNANNIDFFVGFGRFWSSGTAGSGNPSQAFYVTVFEQWNGTTKQATNFPVWSAGVLGTNANGIPTHALTPRALPFNALILPVTSVTITNPGSLYTSPPAVSINPVWTGVGALGTSIMELSALVLGVGGSGYPAGQTALSCTVTGGGGSGAVVTAATNGSGVVTGYTIVSRGTGYTSVPTVTVDGGGVGATSTVTLRVLSVTITAPGNSYSVGASISFSGGGGSGAAGTVTVDSGFAWQGRGMGANSTQYHYTVTADMVAYSFRADGATDQGGTYVGTYDRIQSAALDPMPIGVITLIAGTATTQPYSGYGFSTREPGRSTSGPSNALLYDCSLGPRPPNGSGPLVNNASGGVSIYTSNNSAHEFVSSNHFVGRGQYQFPRGTLKNVVYTAATSYTHGDLIFVKQGNTVRYARIVNAGHALMIV